MFRRGDKVETTEDITTGNPTVRGKTTRIEKGARGRVVTASNKGDVGVLFPVKRAIAVFKQNSRLIKRQDDK